MRCKLLILGISLFFSACSNGNSSHAYKDFNYYYQQLESTVDTNKPDERVDFSSTFADLNRQFYKLRVKVEPPIKSSTLSVLERQLPCRLPGSLKKIYLWHNGIQEFIPGYQFLSLSDMVKEYQFQRKLAIKYGLAEKEGWPRYFLPILQSSGKDYIALDCESSQHSPLFEFFVEDASRHARYRGIGHLLAVTLTAYKTGAYVRQDGEINERPIKLMRAFRKNAIPSEVSAMGHNWQVTKKALTALHGQAFLYFSGHVSEIADARMIPLLRERLHDADTKTVAGAAFALGKLQAQDALPDLVSCLSSTSSEVRNYAASAISELGVINSQVAVDRLIQLLNDKDDLVRISAIEALSRVKSKKAGLALLRLLPNSRPGIQRAIIDTLADMGDKQALPALRELRAKVLRMDLSLPEHGGERGYDPSPAGIKADLDRAIQKLGH